jgi:hypothetical protein
MAAEARRSSAALVAAAAVVVALLALAPEASRAERFVVGDAARWTWGYNYTDWVIRKGPFFQNDTLGTYGLSLLADTLVSVSGSRSASLGEIDLY